MAPYVTQLKNLLIVINSSFFLLFIKKYLIVADNNFLFFKNGIKSISQQHDWRGELAAKSSYVVGDPSRTYLFVRIIYL